MNPDILKGKWLQLKGEARRQWGRLTDDDLDQIEGSFEKLCGRIEERYGRARDQVEREARAWLGRLESMLATTERADPQADPPLQPRTR